MSTKKRKIEYVSTRELEREPEPERERETGKAQEGNSEESAAWRNLLMSLSSFLQLWQRSQITGGFLIRDWPDSECSHAIPGTVVACCTTFSLQTSVAPPRRVQVGE